MTARDATLQAAVDRAATELARRIRANPDPKDPDAFAARFMEDLYTGADHWRPWPGRDRWREDTGRLDPDTAHRGAELARDLLKRTTEGDRP